MYAEKIRAMRKRVEENRVSRVTNDDDELSKYILDSPMEREYLSSRTIQASPAIQAPPSVFRVERPEIDWKDFHRFAYAEYCEEPMKSLSKYYRQMCGADESIVRDDPRKIRDALGFDITANYMGLAKLPTHCAANTFFSYRTLLMLSYMCGKNYRPFIVGYGFYFVRDSDIVSCTFGRCVDIVPGERDYIVQIGCGAYLLATRRNV